MALGKKKRTILGIGVGLALLLLIAGAIFYVLSMQQQIAQTETKNAEKEEVKLSDVVARGDYITIQKIYDKKIDQTASGADKAKLQYDAAAAIIASIAGKEDVEAAQKAALQYALGADAVLKTPQTAAQVGQAYYELHNQEKASEYFGLAAKRGKE